MYHDAFSLFPSELPKLPGAYTESYKNHIGVNGQTYFLPIAAFVLERKTAADFPKAKGMVVENTLAFKCNGQIVVILAGSFLPEGPQFPHYQKLANIIKNASVDPAVLGPAYFTQNSEGHWMKTNWQNSEFDGIRDILPSNSAPLPTFGCML